MSVSLERRAREDEQPVRLVPDDVIEVLPEGGPAEVAATDTQIGEHAPGVMPITTMIDWNERGHWDNPLVHELMMDISCT